MKVVETNVAIAANGRGTHANLECQLACVVFLSDVVSKQSIVAIDDIGLMLDEYAKHLSYKGQPDVGDEFFKYLHDHQYYADRVLRVSITPNDMERSGFDELPPNSMDPSDRKFLAVARKSGAKVFNALDTDWHENIKDIEAMGVAVEQLCPAHGCKI
ncbi:hypothetical protein Q1J55_25340 [Pseudomonas syringae]|uniref:hypothetical protein n=1 Tax=Pseudomonas syringae group TaxID=136849 RepID=UPI0010FAC67E|nr:hypothetical protein [Pseudomonas viridiflava]